VLDVKRREHDFVPGFHPDGAERAADPARADDADLRFPGTRRTQGQGVHRQGSPGNHKESTTILFHGNASTRSIIRLLMA
jgi:hypothetical protein